jgi:hypothetical protein
MGGPRRRGDPCRDRQGPRTERRRSAARDLFPARRYRIHKGEAHYYTIVAKSGPIKDAAWTYAEPKQAVGEIACYIAFDTERVAVEEL